MYIDVYIFFVLCFEQHSIPWTPWGPMGTADTMGQMFHVSHECTCHISVVMVYPTCAIINNNRRT